MRKLFIAFTFVLLFVASPALADGEGGGGENASNPLSKGKNIDLRLQYLDSDNGHINDMFIDGAFMANDKLKIKYELHYWETNITGNSHDDFESAMIKGIYFPKEGVLGDMTYRLAVGIDWIVDLGDKEKGIGSNSDQIGPFAGIALGLKGGTMIIPLVQQFLSYSWDDVNTTAFRLIALKPLPKQMWIKLDGMIPVDWENDTIPAAAELQLGKNINESIALYIDGLIGIGGDKPYDWGLGTGIRFKY